MSKPLWTPSEKSICEAAVTRFQASVNQPDYRALYQWSVDNPAAFWSEVWDFCGVRASVKGDVVLLDGDKMPGASWFPEARLNFAENLLSNRDDSLAIVSLLENGDRRALSYAELYQRVADTAAALNSVGVGKGDRVAGFMPNIAEAVIAMLATSSLGAIWSSCSPDFGIQGVMNCFGQIQPRVLFCADGYFYNGKSHSSLERIADIAQRIAAIEKVVVVPLTTSSPDVSAVRDALLFDDFAGSGSVLEFAQLRFDHPLYIMYSSGTTGVPKCIVHGAGGTLLQHLKEQQLACDIGAEDVFFYFTTCGWMMWNWLVSGLASGATLVLYDGSPFAEEGRLLLDAIDREGITVFGTSAKFIVALEKVEIKPKESHDLSSLKAILSTGSPLSHESFEYVYRDFKQDVCLSSIAGGTDIISCFVGGSPVLPIYTGEIQCRGLGMAVEFWDDNGHALQPGDGQKGELVCVKSFPCMPVGFWNDADGCKYHEAYFDQYDNIWCHGDYGEMTDSGGVIIHGRSDAALNPGGVRIGTAEIYWRVEKLDEIVESIVIGQDWQGDVRVVLFVVLQAGVALTDDLRQQIRASIRKNTTPRHVPAKIIAVTDIPRTLSGKIVELAVSRVVHNQVVKNTDALANPEALDLYRDLPELRS